jgi:hypothetical protein
VASMLIGFWRAAHHSILHTSLIICLVTSNVARFADGSTSKEKLVLHMSNSPVHESRAVTEKVASMRLASAPYPPYSSDLALPKFFLFVYLQGKTIEIDFGSPRELIGWIQ